MFGKTFVSETNCMILNKNSFYAPTKLKKKTIKDTGNQSLMRNSAYPQKGLTLALSQSYSSQMCIVEDSCIISRVLEILTGPMGPCGDFSPFKNLGSWGGEEDHDLFQPSHLVDRRTDDQRG